MAAPYALAEPSSALAARLFNAWQRDFPLVARPFDVLGKSAGMDGAQVQETLRQGLARGEVSRVGAVFGVGAGGSGIGLVEVYALP